MYQLKEDLKRSQQRYQSFIANSSEGIWCFESDPIPITIAPDQQIDAIYEKGYMVECNDMTARMYGYANTADIIGIKLKDLLPRNPENLAYLKGFIESGYSLIDVQSQEVDSEGNIKYFLNSMRGIVEDGFLIRAWGTQRDVTMQVDALKKIEASERQFKQMADSMPQMVWTATADGSITYLNNQWVQFMGFSQTDRNWFSLIHPDEVHEVLLAWNKAVTAGTKFEVECRLEEVLNPGNYKWFLGRATAIRDENSNIIQWFGTCTDISELKYLQQQKDEFTSIASHELKTPLTCVKAYAQLMLNNLNKNDLAYTYGSKVLHHASRLEKLIGDLLDVSKINAGKLTLNKTNFNIKELIEESIQSIGHLTHSDRIQIKHALDLEYFADRQRLEEVLNNLLTNALKYSDETSPVIVDSTQTDNQILITVKDFGIGIYAEHLDKLFDKFYRVDNTSMRYPGLGLGLYISSEIVKQHKGTLHVESQPGVGSVFSFTLPLK